MYIYIFIYIYIFVCVEDVKDQWSSDQATIRIGRDAHAFETFTCVITGPTMCGKRLSWRAYYGVQLRSPTGRLKN